MLGIIFNDLFAVVVPVVLMLLLFISPSHTVRLKCCIAAGFSSVKKNKKVRFIIRFLILIDDFHILFSFLNIFL